MAHYQLNQGENINLYKSIYNYNLGWTGQNSDEYYQRSEEPVLQRNHCNGRVHFYGSSFVYSPQLANNKSIPYILSQELKTVVFNYGLPGYGLDQMFLKSEFINKLNQKNNCHPKLVIVAITEEDLTHLMSRTHLVIKEYFGGPFLGKPMFKLNGDKLDLIVNPIARLNEVENIYRTEWVSDLIQNEWTFKKFKTPVFPFLLSKNFWQLEWTHDQRYYPFSEPEVVQLYKKIIVLFKTEANKNGSDFLLIRFPTITQFDQSHSLLFTKEFNDSSHTFYKTCESLKIKCFYPSAQILNSAKEDVFYINSGNHYSAETNRLFAKILSQYVIDERIKY